MKKLLSAILAVLMVVSLAACTKPVDPEPKPAEEGKVFTNTFSAEGKAKPEGYKELTNRLPELGEFKFEIKEGDSVIATVESTDDLNSEQNKKKIKMIQ